MLAACTVPPTQVLLSYLLSRTPASHDIATCHAHIITPSAHPHPHPHTTSHIPSHVAHDTTCAHAYATSLSHALRAQLTHTQQKRDDTTRHKRYYAHTKHITSRTWHDLQPRDDTARHACDRHIRACIHTALHRRTWSTSADVSCTERLDRSALLAMALIVEEYAYAVGEEMPASLDPS